ncbi:MAG TPA: hypothetical protein VJK05_01140 [archaeon]|nr:hypothetical protein [archaeon]
MLLNKPFFSISLPLDKVHSSIESFLADHYWTDFQHVSTKIIFTPHYFFNYDIYFEKDSEALKKKVISGHESGAACINSNTGKLTEKIAEIFAGTQSKKEFDLDIPFEIISSKVSEKEVREIAPLRIASKFSLPKENVVISALEEVLVPEFFAKYRVEEVDYEFKADAVSGEILNPEVISEKQRSWKEAAKETFSELKSPSAWAGYASEVAGKASMIHPKKVQEMERNQRRLIIYALIVFLVLLLIVFFFVLK